MSLPSSSCPNLKRELAELEERDTLIIPRLTRLSADVIETLEIIGDLYCRRIRLVVLHEHFDSTSSDSGSILRIVFSLLAIERAKSQHNLQLNRRFKFGRPPSFDALEVKEVEKRLEKGECIQDLAAFYGCSRYTISRIKNRKHIFSTAS